MPNCSVAVCGSQFNKYQLNLLIRTCQPREIVICFDKEELEGEDKYFNKLYSLCKKYTNYCTVSFIYDRNNLLKLKESQEELFNRYDIKSIAKMSGGVRLFNQSLRSF